ncbi:hypothetical protein JCM10450v2_004539 [Rhodotorula kratochvilovae]
MLTNTALSLSVAATLASTAAAFHSPVLHNHGIRSGSAHAAHAHKARDFVPVRAALQARGNARRMAKRVRRSETASYLELADNSTTTSASTDVSGTKYTSTAIWWKEAGWIGSCGVEIKETDNVVALPLALYPDVDAKSSLCGTTVSVTATASGKTISATVVGASNRDDYTTFSKGAYLALEGDLDVGELAIEYYVDGSHADLSNLVAEKKVVATTSSAAAPKTTTTTQAPKPTTTTTQQEVAKTAAPVKAVVKQTTTSAAPTTTTTSAKPAATSSASSDEDDDDWVCDDEEEESSSSSVWVAPSSAAAKVASTSEWVAPTTTTTTTQAQQTTSSQAAQAATTKVADTGDTVSLLKKQGITGFLYDNSNAILSWYNTNSGQDSTNGNSWCGFPYDNNVPGFAPSLKTMLASTGGDYEAAAKMYCGLEAVVTTPEGKTMTLYLADAFDDTWVLTPSSIDIIHGAFTTLFGSYTDNKNDVVKNANWKFTGNRNDKYKFKSTNSLS